MVQLDALTAGTKYELQLSATSSAGTRRATLVFETARDPTSNRLEDLSNPALVDGQQAGSSGLGPAPGPWRHAPLEEPRASTQGPHAAYAAYAPMLIILVLFLAAVVGIVVCFRRKALRNKLKSAPLCCTLILIALLVLLLHFYWLPLPLQM